MIPAKGIAPCILQAVVKPFASMAYRSIMKRMAPATRWYSSIAMGSRANIGSRLLGCWLPSISSLSPICAGMGGRGPLWRLHQRAPARQRPDWGYPCSGKPQPGPTHWYSRPAAAILSLYRMDAALCRAWLFVLVSVTRESESGPSARSHQIHGGR